MITTHFMMFFAGEAEPAGPGVPTSRVRAGGLGPGAFALKAPGSVVDWGIEWTLEAGETIVGSTWTITQLDPDDGVAVVAGSPRIEGDITVVMLAGGVFRRSATVTNTIITSAGRTLQESFSLRIGPVEAGA